MAATSRTSRLDAVRRYLQFQSPSTEREKEASEATYKKYRGVEEEHKNGWASSWASWAAGNGTMQHNQEETRESGHRQPNWWCDFLVLVLVFAVSMVLTKIYYLYSADIYQAAAHGTDWAYVLVTNTSVSSISRSIPSFPSAAVSTGVSKTVGSAAWLWSRAAWVVLPFLAGLALVAFSWIIIYLDSDVPGQVPPSPISPMKVRLASGYTCHLNYLATAFNGIALCAILLWNSYSDEQ